MNRRGSAAAVVLIAALVSACSNSEESTTLDVRYTVSHACVRPGGEQRVVATTEPGAEIGYVPVYADGTGQPNPPLGEADKKGRYEAAWTVPATAPPGEVRLAVIGAKGKKVSQDETTFKIAGPDGTCAP